MLKIHTEPVVNFDDISDELGIHMSECSFTEMAENGSYVILDLSDYRIEEIKEEIEWSEERHGGPNKFSKKYRNDLRILEALREITSEEYVLVYVSW